MDEATFSLNYPVRCCWMKRGQQKQLPAFSARQREYLHLIGAYNWHSAGVTVVPVERKNSQSFIAFLEYLLLEVYVNAVVVLVLDNASYHHSAAVRAALSLFEHRVAVVWLPEYCPELNLIERFWLHLKATATANTLYPSRQALEENLTRCLQQQNDPSDPYRLTFSKVFQ